MSTESIFPTNDPEYDAVYAQEAAMVDASELIAAALETSQMTKTQLAAALGVSKSEISARVAGARNITVRSLAATLHALGARLELTQAGGTNAGTEERRRYAAWQVPARESSDNDAAHRHTRAEWSPRSRAQ